MPRLPTVGEDADNWGTVLNEYLKAAHNPDGTLKLDVKTIADLRTVDVTSLTDKQQALVAGYYAPGDGGGGQFYYDAAASGTDNGGTIFAPSNGGGRWKRVWDQSRAHITWFGVFPDPHVDQTTRLQAGINAVSEIGSLIHIPSGIYRVRNLKIQAKTRIVGSGPSTVLKLLDGSTVADHVLCCASTDSGIDNVYIGHITVNGNSSLIGLTDVSMHGIIILGGHRNWTIEHVYAEETCGDGITVSTPNGGTPPENIRISHVECRNNSRQSISVVRAVGVTIADCSGDGRLDLEANAGDGASLFGAVVTNVRFGSIQIIGRGAEGGGFVPNNISASGLYAKTEVKLWQTANASVSGLLCGGAVIVSECDRVNITGVVARNIIVMAPNGTAIRNCLFSNFQVSCAVQNTPALRVSNAVDCTFHNFDIRSAGVDGDGVQISNSSAQAGGFLSFKNFTIMHNRYGFYVIPTLLEGVTINLTNTTIRNEGTKALYVSTAANVSYGEIAIKNCELFGGATVSRFKKVWLDDVNVFGNYDVLLRDSVGGSIVIGRLKFLRSTAGTPAVNISNNAQINSLSIGEVEQSGFGNIALGFTSSTFAGGSKAWINGPVVEAGTWADVLGSNVQAGSSFRLRGSATHWGFTYNGVAWIAKAH